MYLKLTLPQCLAWLIETKQIPDVLWDPQQIAFVDWTEPVNVQDAKLKAFQTTRNERDGYQDWPCILISTVHSIETGISLVPADTVVYMDADYIPAAIEQTGGRVSRNALTQKAQFTGFYRFIGWASWMPLSLYQAQRNVALSKIQSSIIGRQDGAGVDEEIVKL